MKEKEAVHIKINTYMLDDNPSNLVKEIVTITPCIILDYDNSYN